MRPPWQRGLECPPRIFRRAIWDLWVSGERISLREAKHNKKRAPGAPFFVSTEAYLSLRMARKTLSSMGTVGVKTVALLLSGRASWRARPASAGPAGLAEAAGRSPGSKEMRVVWGVQFAVARHVSRTKTWRRPLFAPLTTLPLAAVGA